MKKVRAGGAVDYYIGQVRSGMADYYLAETGLTAPGGREGLYAPGNGWWGGSAAELSLSGAIGDDTFVALFDRAEHPDGSGRHVGRRFRHASRLAAHQTIADSHHQIASLGRLGAIYEDACRRATRQWAADTLARHGLHVTGDPKWPALVAKLRQLALEGHDQQHLLTLALEAPVGDVQSAAAVLHWRLDNTTATAAPVRPRGLGAAIPPGDNADTALARQTVELMRHRWLQLHRQLWQETTPRWAMALGARPAARDMLDSWLTAATAAAAYRERYELADHTELIGPRPARSRPDARAAPTTHNTTSTATSPSGFTSSTATSSTGSPATSSTSSTPCRPSTPTSSTKPTAPATASNGRSARRPTPQTRHTPDASSTKPNATSPDSNTSPASTANGGGQQPARTTPSAASVSSNSTSLPSHPSELLAGADTVFAGLPLVDPGNLGSTRTGISQLSAAWAKPMRSRDTDTLGGRLRDL